MDFPHREDSEYRGYKYRVVAVDHYRGLKPKQYKFHATIFRYRQDPHDHRSEEAFDSMDEAMEKGRNYVHRWVDLHPLS